MYDNLANKNRTMKEAVTKDVSHHGLLRKAFTFIYQNNDQHVIAIPRFGGG